MIFLQLLIGILFVLFFHVQALIIISIYYGLFIYMVSFYPNEINPLFQPKSFLQSTCLFSFIGDTIVLTSFVVLIGQVTIILDIIIRQFDVSPNFLGANKINPYDSCGSTRPARFFLLPYTMLLRAFFCSCRDSFAKIIKSLPLANYT